MRTRPRPGSNSRRWRHRGWIDSTAAWGLGAALGWAVGCDPSPPREARSVGAPSAPAAGGAAEAELEAPAVDEPVPATGLRETASLEGLAPAERARFEQALAEGRRLHHAQDYAGAMAAYDRALDVLPDDPRTLSELGWSALHANRLDDADAALRRAEAGVEEEADPSLLASILYNRGRVAQARDDESLARQAYQASLRLRPHPATYQHLLALPGGSRYVFGPRMHRLQGPYARLSELCAEERTLSAGAGEAEEGEAFACLHDAGKGVGGSAVEVPRDERLPAPWKGVRFVETRPNPFIVRFHAALRTSEGWFVMPDVAELERGTTGTTERATRLVARTEELLLGGAPEVVLEVETRWVRSEEGTERESETHRVELLCGVGPSGIPHCTGALPRAMQVERREGRAVEKTEWTIERRTRPEGSIVLEGEPEALDEPAAALLGVHAVELP
ncbi:tetratricopeptide repeat protein [Paraliomyxa miuraensis]|uniref:tetratricopeptide repeat protein n=1 Tax=Paraliomyxa miuraensis TaxID=376150 RepID=UPI002251FD79|nr:tetratricopeptide repeat protein [Paraliomyxa miuraensis]MCX4246368.1 tetratricopeptide repeat protein [Paraliomyxa miuraensis]